MASIHEVVGEDTVREMDILVARLGGFDTTKIPGFAAGRNASARIFAERDVPEDIVEAVKIVRDEVHTTAFEPKYAETPEFALGAMLLAYAVAMRGEKQ